MNARTFCKSKFLRVRKISRFWLSFWKFSRVSTYLVNAVVFIYFCPFFILGTYIQSTNFGVNLLKNNKVIGEKFSWCTTLVNVRMPHFTFLFYCWLKNVNKKCFSISTNVSCFYGLLTTSLKIDQLYVCPSHFDLLNTVMSSIVHLTYFSLSLQIQTKEAAMDYKPLPYH